MKFRKQRSYIYKIHMKPKYSVGQTWLECMKKYEARYESIKNKLDFYFGFYNKYKKSLQAKDIAS